MKSNVFFAALTVSHLAAACPGDWMPSGRCAAAGREAGLCPCPCSAHPAVQPAAGTTGLGLAHAEWGAAQPAKGKSEEKWVRCKYDVQNMKEKAMDKSNKAIVAWGMGRRHKYLQEMAL